MALHLLTLFFRCCVLLCPQEAVPSSIEFLTLHHLVDQLALHTKNELYKLTLLKDVQGELSLKDEVRYRKLRKQMEKVILQNADVVTTTCVGCGDPRLENFRFRQGQQHAHGTDGRTDGQTGGRAGAATKSKHALLIMI